MNYLFYYQFLPLVVLFFVFIRLERLDFFQRFGVPILFVLGILLQFSYWHYSHPNLENPDSMGYYRLGHGLENDLRNILFRPKFYPIFLGLFTALKTATFFQCVLKVGIGFFMLRIAKILAWKRGTLFFSLTLFFVNSFWLQEPLKIMDTTLFTFCFTATTWLFIETSFQYSGLKFLGLCLFSGIATLTRQVGDLSILMMGLMLIVFFVQKEKLKSIHFLTPFFFVSLLLGALIGFSGLLWNGVHYGIYQRTIGVGNALYTHFSYYQLANGQNEEWKFVDQYLPQERTAIPSWNTNYHSDIPWAVNALPHHLERAILQKESVSIVELDKIFSGRAIDWIQSNPKNYVASVGNEAMRLMWKCEEYYPESMLQKLLKHFGGHAPLFMVRVERGIIHQSIGLMFIVSLFGLALEKKLRLQLLIPLMGIATYLILIPAIQLGFTRYGFPVIPILLILFGHACDQIRIKFARRSV